MQINQPKGIKPKMGMYIKKQSKLLRGIKAERCKRNGPNTRTWCTSIMNVCDTSYFVLFSWTRIY